MTVLETANQPACERTGLAVDELLAPLVRARVVEKHRHALPMPLRAIRFDFLERRAAAPHFAHSDRSIQFDRFIRAGERMRPALDLRFPQTEVEVEVVCAIALG